MADPIIPRRFATELPDRIPRHWLPGDVFVSSMLNTYTVLVPANEAFYIRALKESLPRIENADLRNIADAFIRQEAQHGVAHRRYWRNLERQGYRFRGFERWVDTLTFKLMDRIAPLSLRLSMVSCVEHINAVLAHEFLSQGLLADAEPRMRALMEWHFAEEIEHKNVAFDVLRSVSPAYAIRLMGFIIAAPLFLLVFGLGSCGLLWQDASIWRPATWRAAWRHLVSRHRMVAHVSRALCAYLRPAFHPSDIDDVDLARSVIARYAAERPPWVLAEGASHSRAPDKPGPQAA